MTNQRIKVRNLNIALFVLALVALTTACRKSEPQPPKTAEQRAEEYHQYLTTPDLTLMELEGCVSRVIYPKGYLAQYVAGADERPDTISFDPNGMCHLSLVQGGDSLRPVRTTDGRIVQLKGKTEQSPTLTLSYNADGLVSAWECHNIGGAAHYSFEHSARRVTKITGANAELIVQITKSDDLGNWTERTLTHTVDGHPTTVVQQRVIEYY